MRNRSLYGFIFQWFFGVLLVFNTPLLKSAAVEESAPLSIQFAFSESGISYKFSQRSERDPDSGILISNVAITRSTAHARGTLVEDETVSYSSWDNLGQGEMISARLSRLFTLVRVTYKEYKTENIMTATLARMDAGKRYQLFRGITLFSSRFVSGYGESPAIFFNDQTAELSELEALTSVGSSTYSTNYEIINEMKRIVTLLHQSILERTTL